MPVIEKTVDAKPMPQMPEDTSVAIPKSVRAAAARADAIHQQTYQTQATPQPDPTPASPAPQPDPTPATPVQQADPRDSWTPEQWVHHAKSIEGRYKAQQKSMETMQTQMTELGDELLRTQALARPQTQQPNVSPVPLAPSVRLLTPEDEQAYGPEMLDVVKRAAVEAVSPQLQTLQVENERLRKQMQRTTTTTVAQALDAQVPEWQSINVSPKFKNWLRFRDVYSGAIRDDLLKAAFKAADAARVVAFFKGFLAEEAATGSLDTPLPYELPAQTSAPRASAVPLETLTAPGRAKPPTGNVPLAADSKPVITYAQIRQFYDNVRKGVYVARDQDKANDEAFIFECQREGRVR